MSSEPLPFLSSSLMIVKGDLKSWKGERQADWQRFCYHFEDRVAVQYQHTAPKWMCLSATKPAWYLLPPWSDTSARELEDAVVRWCVTGKRDPDLVKLHSRYLGLYVAYTLPG